MGILMLTARVHEADIKTMTTKKTSDIGGITIIAVILFCRQRDVGGAITNQVMYGQKYRRARARR